LAVDNILSMHKSLSNIDVTFFQASISSATPGQSVKRACSKDVG
jgi:hypothetical protein